MHRAIPAFLLAAITAALLSACSDPTEGIYEAQVNAPAQIADATPAEPAPVPEPATAEPAATTYVLNEDSIIGFEGYKVTGSHLGGFGKFEGIVTVPAEGIEAASIDVKIDMTSTYSDDPGLTTKLIGPDFFDVEQFPEAKFQSTSITPSEDGYTVSGDLTLHGKTQNISFPAQISIDGETLIAEAEFTINRMDFAIEYAGMADDLIKEKVVIRLDIEASPAP